MKKTRARIPNPVLRPQLLQHAVRGVINPPGRPRPGVGQWAGSLFAATLIGLAPPALGQSFELSAIDGTNGFKINGERVSFSGRSVSDAGDVNGDGIDDLIIGASAADSNTGASYVVFGSNQSFSTGLELANLDGTNGFKISGEQAGDLLGESVSGAGDINGDGIADVVIGTSQADPNGQGSGASYVVFGSSQRFSTPFELASLNGTNGFKIYGETAFDRLGSGLAAAGDINDDGIADLAIGAFGATGGSGVSYVVFGSSQGFSSALDLSGLDGTNGFRINGEPASFSGFSMSGAGDVNGDGIADLVIGAFAESTYGSATGASYVVFGSNQGFSSALDLSSLDGTNGFRINGEMTRDQSGLSVSGAGDVNGDGIDDLIIGAHEADPNGFNSGASYVVFGSNQGFSTPLRLSSLDGTNGFKINGEAEYDYSGRSVSTGGDVNGDGIADLVIGAFRADPNGSESGASYVVFGSDQGFGTPLELADLDGANGFKINGEGMGDRSGRSVSAAGDMNGDGIADLVIGADEAEPNGALLAGASYVVFGSPSIGKTDAAPLLRCPGDINGDGSQEISALVHNTADRTLTAFIKEAETGRPISQVEFDGSFRPVDMEVMADINGNNAPELVVLGEGSVKGEVRDSLTGELLGSVDFSPSLSPVDLELVPDQDGNAVGELAHLGEGSTRVEVKDPVTSGRISTVSFSNQIVPRDLSVFGLNGALTLGVLGEHTNPNKSDKVELRDLANGSLVRNLFLEKGWRVRQLELLSDMNGNNSQEAAVVQVHPNDNRVRVLVKDTKTGKKLSRLGFDAEYPPVKMGVVPDINGNGSDEVVVFGVRFNEANQKAWVKDGRNNKSIKQVFFNPRFIGQDLAVCPDMNGNGVSELVMLGQRQRDGQLKAFIKDAKTGRLIGRVVF